MTTDFKLRLVTWNVGESDPPDNLEGILGLDKKDLPGLVAVGLQEIKASTSSIIADSVFDDPWTNKLTKVLGAKNYVRVENIRLLGIHLGVYVRRTELHHISYIEKNYTGTGLGGFWGNKGGVSVRLDISGVNLCIVNSHLAAHQNEWAARIENIEQIIETQTFKAGNGLNILDHDYVFWIGDLNFRLDDIPNDEVKLLIRQRSFKELWQYDQLKKLMKDELVFIDFVEGPLDFEPTYKYDAGTDEYDTSSKQRKPGWCDRILWLAHEDSFEGVSLNVEQLSYTNMMSYLNSDHKPVFSDMRIKVLTQSPEQPVLFDPVGRWTHTQDGVITYSVLPEVEVSSWDWIGIYKADYTHFKSYITYVWVPSSSDCIMGDGRIRFKVTVDRSYIQECAGTYSLCYHSSKHRCMMGYSDTFQVVLTEADSSTDSSTDSSSDSDT